MRVLFVRVHSEDKLPEIQLIDRTSLKLTPFVVVTIRFLISYKKKCITVSCNVSFVRETGEEVKTVMRKLYAEKHVRVLIK